MVKYYSRPTTQERLLVFGDGNEALLLTVLPSTREGFLYFVFRPTDKMRSAIQIPQEHYHPDDNWVHKLYRADLCYLLNPDPDFTVWIVMCDYFGGEHTPFIEHFFEHKQLIERKRALEQDIKILKADNNRMRLKLRLIAEHPNEYIRDILQHFEWVQEKIGRQQVMLPPEPTPER